ncbi:hypothetical protein [Nitratireductor rhodophyticola]|uniref:hypothetical protein n=1 Tax=Nitratireductor rhodophyticola TaxID=2854036 RepID=UPI003008C199
MGEKKRRLDVFRKAHPYCCFCGGNSPTESIDHIPAKILFTNSQLPGDKKFEFPSCYQCNHASKQYDQIAALLTLSTIDANATSSAHFQKVASGVKNNARKAISDVVQGATGQRHRSKQLSEAFGIPVQASKLDGAALLSLKVLGAKIGMAHYYEDNGIPLAIEGGLWTMTLTPAALLEGGIPEFLRFGEPFEDLTSKCREKEQIKFRSIRNKEEGLYLYQILIRDHMLITSIVDKDMTRHSESQPYVIRPGFLKSLQNPAPLFSTSLSIQLKSND